MQIFAAMADQQKTEAPDDAHLKKDPGAVAFLGLQGLCGAALVAGIKTLPAYYGLSLIAHPVATIRCALVSFFRFFKFYYLFPMIRRLAVDFLDGNLLLFFLENESRVSDVPEAGKKAFLGSVRAWKEFQIFAA